MNTNSTPALMQLYNLMSEGLVSNGLCNAIRSRVIKYYLITHWGNRRKGGND